MSTPRADTDPATVRDLKRIYKRFGQVENLISDAFAVLAATDDRLTQNVDEAINKADRAQRAVRRLKKEFDALE